MAKWVGNITWVDVPHISAEKRDEYEAAYLPHEKEARMKGFPTIGSGKIYPIPESDFVVPPFEIPGYWKRAYAMDVGFVVTCAIFGAYDEHNDVWYIYDEYYSKRAEPPIHAAAVRNKAKGWIPGAIDPSAMRGNERDGKKLMLEYRDLGLDPLYLADNSVEVGITRILNGLAGGRIKVFLNCQNLLAEYRIYRYDDSGRVARNQDDHAMDAWRYLINTGERIAVSTPDDLDGLRSTQTRAHYTRDEITGC